MTAAVSPVVFPQSGGGGPGGSVAGSGPLYSGVLMSLDSSLIPEENRRDTPSQRDGLQPHTETELRILGCELIQSAGILLRLPQVAMATGQVLFQRFFYSKSFIKHNFEVVAMACVTLASKIEESPRRARDVINVFHHLKQRGAKRSLPLILDHNYINTKNQVIKAERRVLKELGFCVHVKHPHKMIVMYLQVLECEKNQVLVQTAWNYMNDALRTDAFVRFEPETIACACIYLAARTLQIPLPSEPHWFLLFGASEAEVRKVCASTLQLYIREKPNLEELETEVETLKARLEEEKMMRSGSGGVTPALSLVSTFSPAKLSSPREQKGEETKKIASEKKENQEQHSNSAGSSTDKENRIMHNGHTTSRGRSTSHSPQTRSRSTSSSVSSVPSPRQRRGSPRERRKPSRHDDRRRRSRSRGHSRYREPRRSRERSGSSRRRRR